MKAEPKIRCLPEGAADFLRAAILPVGKVFSY